MAAKKIEIFENTLLKLLIRRGLDADRMSIVLTESELGYTTDTKRLYIGDGSTLGGLIVGNKFLGEAVDHTTFTEGGLGDFAFNNTTNKLYAKTVSSWLEIGGVYDAGNTTILINNNNQITVGTLSAGNVATDLLGNSLELDTNNRVSLSGIGISTDSIVARTGSYLKLPKQLSINNVNYDWPVGGIGSNLFLKTDISGDLSWSPAIAPATYFFNSSGGPIPVGTIMPYVSANGAPYGWLLCNGQEVNGSTYPALSAVIGESFGSSTPGTTFKVPNYINSALYGVNNNPASSTIFAIASGSNSALSARGSLLIIKAIPDTLVQSSLIITDSLSATVNNITQTSIAFSPLSGNIAIGLPTFFENSQTVNSGTSFEIDEYGRVTSLNLSSAAGNPLSAGIVTAPNGTNVYNNTSPIVFLQQPVQIITTGANNQSFSIQVFPEITDYTGVPIAGNPKVSPDAKNVILETYIDGKGSKFIWTAPNISLLGGAQNEVASPYELLLGSVQAGNSKDRGRNVSQAFAPLSASNTGSLQLAFRSNNSGGNNFYVKIVGYTR